MATQLMKDWIVELHNPERKQKKGQLGFKDLEGNVSHCCLGVLCEVKGIEAEESESYEYDYGSEDRKLIGFGLAYEDREALPPDELIAELFGDKYTEPYQDNVVLGVDEYGNDLMADHANDELGWSFKKIARAVMAQHLSTEEQFEVGKRIEDKGWA